MRSVTVPVSYTHLDVYKRQRSPSAAVSALLPVSYTAMARLPHAVCIKVRAGARIYSILSVSYTHLSHPTPGNPK